METSNHISKSSGFKVPETYFKDFKIKDLETNKRKQESGFSVPDAYFDDFKVKTPQKTKIISISDKQKTFAIAASLLVLLGTLLLGLILKPQPQQELNFSKIDKSVLENYLEDEMFMDTDLYVENEELYYKFSTKNLSDNKIIDNMDDTSIEQLIDY